MAKQKNDFILEKPLARTKLGEADSERETGCLRIYGESPEAAALQIRTYGSVAPRSRGVYRLAYSTVSLTADDIEKVIEELKVQRARLLGMIQS